jgi:hypothetical protein
LVARYLITWHRFIGVLGRTFLLRRNSAAVH